MVVYAVRMLCGVVALVGFITAQTTPNSAIGRKQEVQLQGVVPPYQVQVGGTALERPIDPAEYIVGPGDRFIVSILSTAPYLELVTVTPAEAMVLPEVGTVPVVGLSAEAVRVRVLEFIQEIYPTYEASCTLYGIREIRVSVSGAVGRPGFYEVTPLSRVSDLIASADRIRPRAALHRVELVRKPEAARTIDLSAFYNEGDLSQNPLLKGGDRVVVPYGDVTNDLVLVQALDSTAYYAVRPEETLASLMRRIDRGERADLATVTLERAGRNDSSKPEQISANRFESVTVVPGDVLFIHPIADVAVVGEVHEPGRFTYQPGLMAEDYVVYAGGINREGSARNIEITRDSGQTLRGGDNEIRAGDTIHVARSFNSVFLGQLGVVQVALTFFNIYLAYLATQ